MSIIGYEGVVVLRWINTIHFIFIPNYAARTRCIYTFFSAHSQNIRLKNNHCFFGSFQFSTVFWNVNVNLVGFCLPCHILYIWSICLLIIALAVFTYIGFSAFEKFDVNILCTRYYRWMFLWVCFYPVFNVCIILSKNSSRVHLKHVKRVCSSLNRGFCLTIRHRFVIKCATVKDTPLEY